MSAPYPVGKIANAFLEIAWRDNGRVSPMKLQKLVYLAHGLNLALYGKPLIDARVEAWKYGPVIAPLYYETRHYGSSSINNPITLESSALFSDDLDEDVGLDDSTRSLLLQVWEAYGGISAVGLSSLTHQSELPEGAPWHKTWHENGGRERWGTDIPDELIEKSFKDLLIDN